MFDQALFIFVRLHKIIDSIGIENLVVTVGEHADHNE